MTSDLIKKMLKLLGATKISSSGGWVKSSCIFKHWFHANGTDNTPSFGISINDKGKSGFHCFTCRAKGPELIDMVLEIRRLNHKIAYLDLDIKELLHLCALEEDSQEDLFDDFPTYEDLVGNKGVVVNPFPEIWLESFQKAYQHKYLIKREVPHSIAKTLDIRYDGTRNRVCFPIRDKQGRLAGMQGRAIDDNPIRYYLYPYQGRFNPFVWHNEQHMDLQQPLIICEGVFDSARIMSAGYLNVVSSLTSKITNDKYKRAQDAEEIITYFDVGTGGDTGRALVDKLFKQASIVHVVPDPPYKDAGETPVHVLQEAIQEALDMF